MTCAEIEFSDWEIDKERENGGRRRGDAGPTDTLKLMT
jgi:hypothetical protein